MTPKEHRMREVRLRWFVISRERIQLHLQRCESIVLWAYKWDREMPKKNLNEVIR